MIRYPDSLTNDALFQDAVVSNDYIVEYVAAGDNCARSNGAIGTKGTCVDNYAVVESGAWSNKAWAIEYRRPTKDPSNISWENLRTMWGRLAFPATHGLLRYTHSPFSAHIAPHPEP